MFAGFKITMRTRSKTFSEGRVSASEVRREVGALVGPRLPTREGDKTPDVRTSVARQRKLSVFEPRSAST